MATFADGAADSTVSDKCGDDFAWIFRPDAGAKKSCDCFDMDPFSRRAGIDAVVCGKFLLPCVPFFIAAKLGQEIISTSFQLAEGIAK